MGLLSDLTKDVLGAMGGAQAVAPGAPAAAAGGTQAAILHAALDLIQQHGGIAGLAQSFQQGGLGNLMQSWIATGPNPPVSASQLENVIGGAKLNAVAQKYGIDPRAASSALATILPTLVDKLTPQGVVPAGGAGALGGIFKELGLG